MLFTTYREQAARTCPTLYVVHRPKWLQWLFKILLIFPFIRREAERRDSAHMIMGMVSETYELTTAMGLEDNVNIGEEITDKLWYAANLLNLWRATVDERLLNYNPKLGVSKVSKIMYSITNIESELADYIKKDYAYHKVVLKNKHIPMLLEYIDLLFKLYKFFGLDAKQQMQNNIDKLRARFPQKFDTVRANNRDLEKERRELEK